MNNIKHILSTMAIFLISYGVMGFVMWNWNPATWDTQIRGMLVFIWVALGLLYPLFYNMFKQMRDI